MNQDWGLGIELKQKAQYGTFMFTATEKQKTHIMPSEKEEVRR